MLINGKEVYTIYDAISKQIAFGVWNDTMCFAQRNMTLDFYYRLYSLVLQYFPNKPYGYQHKLLNLRDKHYTRIINQMGGGCGTITKQTIKDAVREMEAPCSH